MKNTVKTIKKRFFQERLVNELTRPKYFRICSINVEGRSTNGATEVVTSPSILGVIIKNLKTNTLKIKDNAKTATIFKIVVIE